MSAMLNGLTLSQARARIERARPAARGARQRGGGDGRTRPGGVEEDGDRRPVLIVRGQARLIDATAAEDLDRSASCSTSWGQGGNRLGCSTARAKASDAHFIGSENSSSLSGSSLIAKPVRALDGRVVGVVAVIGPTR